MSGEQLQAAVKYIMTHVPQATELETIDAAIVAVTNGECHACTEVDLVNRDEEWMVPEEERKKFAGIKGRGWAEGWVEEQRKQLVTAARYAMEHAEEIQKTAMLIDDNKEEVISSRNDLNQMFSDFDSNLNVSSDKDVKDTSNHI